MLVYWLDIVGTAVFAISGVLLAGKLRMDPFGVLVLGVVTAVGYQHNCANDESHYNLFSFYVRLIVAAICAEASDSF